MIPDHYLHIILGAIVALPIGIFIGTAIHSFRAARRKRIDFNQWKRAQIFHGVKL